MALNRYKSVWQVLAFIVTLTLCPSIFATPRLCSKIFSDDSNLEKNILILRQQIDELAKSGGWPMQKSAEDPVVRITFSETSFPITSWKTTKILANNGKVYFGMDVGFENFKADQKEMMDVYRTHLAGPSYKLPFLIDDSGKRKAAIEESKKWRWAFHDAVIESYANHPHKQKYLDIDELSLLGFQNTLAEHSDVFGIVQDRGTPLAQLNKAEILDNVVVTIQLTYASSQYSPLINVDLVRLVNEIRGKSKADNIWLPFIDRMQFPPAEKKEDYIRESLLSQVSRIDISDFRAKFNSEFANKKVAEINRWSKPMSRFFVNRTFDASI